MTIRTYVTPKGGAGTVFYRISVLGGEPTKLIAGVDSPIALSPDGKRLAYVLNDEGRGESRLMTANIDGTGQRAFVTRTFSDMIFDLLC